MDGGGGYRGASSASNTLLFVSEMEGSASMRGVAGLSAGRRPELLCLMRTRSIVRAQGRGGRGPSDVRSGYNSRGLQVDRSAGWVWSSWAHQPSSHVPVCHPRSNPPFLSKPKDPLPLFSEVLQEFYRRRSPPSARTTRIYFLQLGSLCGEQQPKNIGLSLLLGGP